MTKQVNDVELPIAGRRSLLKAVGGSAVIASIGGLAACGGDAPAPAEPRRDTAPEPAEPQADAEPAPVAAEEPTAPAAPTAAQMPRLDQSDPQAQSLAYVANARSIDPSAQPRYSEGQACRNCALYLGEDGAEWGPCSIFPGRLVAAAGWCSVYAPKA